MPATRTRSRRSVAPSDPLPSEPNKHFVRLIRGRIYHLLGSPEFEFRHGEAREVPRQVYDHLAEHAVDHLSYNDPDAGKVRRTILKFEFSPEVPAPPDQVIGW